MNMHDLAAMLNGREIGEEITRDEALAARVAGLVVVYGASDDLVEFEGAIADEVGAYDATTIYLTPTGILPGCEAEGECPHEEALAEACRTIRTHADANIPWSFRTDIPHATFDVMEVGEVFCRGIVFALKDLAPVVSPIAVLLYCPRCALQHVDAPQPEKGWDNPPHRSHECQGCGYVWRPADVATTGVARIATSGQRDRSAKPWTEYDRTMEATGGPAGGVTVPIRGQEHRID